MCGKRALPCARWASLEREEGVQAALFPLWALLELLNGALGSVGQRNTGVVLVLVTVLIYWNNFFSKRELVCVERETEETG